MKIGTVEPTEAGFAAIKKLRQSLREVGNNKRVRAYGRGKNRRALWQKLGGEGLLRFFRPPLKMSEKIDLYLG